MSWKRGHRRERNMSRLRVSIDFALRCSISNPLGKEIASSSSSRGDLNLTEQKKTPSKTFPKERMKSASFMTDASANIFAGVALRHDLSTSSRGKINWRSYAI